jgi:hypothetical protein
MVKFTTLFGRVAGLLVACLVLLLFSESAAAQVPPAWVSAQVTKSYFSSEARRVMDTAGNLYEAGTFLTPALVGGTTLTSQGSLDGYLAKYTPMGTLAWVRQFGSVGVEQAADVAIDATGNAYVVGTFSNTIDIGSGQTLSAGTYTGRKAFLIKYDPAGTPLWAQQNTAYPASNGTTPEGYGFAVQVNAENQVSITGSYGLATEFGFGSLTLVSPISTANPVLMPIFLARFSATTGEPQSILPVLYSDRSTGAGVIYPQLLLNTPTGGNYLVTNYFMAPSFVTGLAFAPPASVNILVAKYDIAGQLEWARTFGGPDFDNVAQAATDAAGNLFLTGSFRQSLTFGTTTLPGSGPGNDDGFLVKYSPQGVEQWAQPLTSSGADFLQGLCLDNASNVYVTGSFGPQAHLGPATLSSAGQGDILVAAYTAKGQLSWVQQAGGPQNDQGSSIGLTPQGRLRVFGYTDYQASFGPFTISNSSHYGFVAELANTPLATISAAHAQPLGLYPNPAASQAHLAGLVAGTQVELFDVLGRLVCNAPVAPDGTVSVLSLQPGLYTLRATDTHGQLLTGRVTVAR